jgi:hypothetical protein
MYVHIVLHASFKCHGDDCYTYGGFVRHMESSHLRACCVASDVGMVLSPGQALHWESNGHDQGSWQICFRTPGGRLPCCSSLCGDCPQLGGQCSTSGPWHYKECGHSADNMIPDEYCRCGCYYDTHYNVAYCDESLSGWEDNCDRTC